MPQVPTIPPHAWLRPSHTRDYTGLLLGGPLAAARHLRSGRQHARQLWACRSGVSATVIFSERCDGVTCGVCHVRVPLWTDVWVCGAAC